MSLLEATLARIVEPDPAIGAETQRLLDGKTKPRRSLGRLEEIACRVATACGVAAPPPPSKAIVVMAADHGVASEGVSAYPAEVTAQMILNFAHGGAAINVLARQVGARVVVADMGVKADPGETAGVLRRRVGPGTRNFLHEPAMSRADALTALESGIEIAHSLVAEGVGLIGVGDMGIGNTTSSSALAASLTSSAAEEVTGRGTGIDDATWARKVDVVRRAVARHRDLTGDPIDTLARLGGFEIAGLAGVILGAAAARVPVVLDGFITGASALIAAALAPAAPHFMVASHRSVERGHRVVLRALGLDALLDLDLRLGEGTGAALAMGLVEAALRLLQEMATFESASVTDAGA